MSDIEKLKNNIENALLLINDLDSPLDAIYDISESVEKVDNIKIDDWLNSEEYQQWEKDYENFYKSWKNVLAYLIKQNNIHD